MPILNSYEILALIILAILYLCSLTGQNMASTIVTHRLSRDWIRPISNWNIVIGPIGTQLFLIYGSVQNHRTCCRLAAERSPLLRFVIGMVLMAHTICGPPSVKFQDCIQPWDLLTFTFDHSSSSVMKSLKPNFMALA